MKKEEWDKLHYKEKDKLIQEKITGKPGNYSRDWNSIMWLIKFIMNETGFRDAFAYDLFEEFYINNEDFQHDKIIGAIIKWTPDLICYIALYNEDFVRRSNHCEGLQECQELHPGMSCYEYQTSSEYQSIREL